MMNTAKNFLKRTILLEWLWNKLIFNYNELKNTWPFLENFAAYDFMFNSGSSLVTNNHYNYQRLIRSVLAILSKVYHKIQLFADNDLNYKHLLFKVKGRIVPLRCLVLSTNSILYNKDYCSFVYHDCKSD